MSTIIIGIGCIILGILVAASGLLVYFIQKASAFDRHW